MACLRDGITQRGLAELLDVTSHILYAAGALAILRLVTNRRQDATAGLIR